MDIDVEFLFYGDEHQLRHLRVLFHTESKDTVDRCLDNCVQLWVHSLEIATGLTVGRPCTVEVGAGSSQFVVIQGQGGADAPAVILRPMLSEQVSMNYHGLAESFVNWRREANPYLFYLRRFIDSRLPIDVRWLNGYRVAEWHFTRGKQKLPDVKEWRVLLEEFEPELAGHLRPRQTLHGLMEQARAISAHAMLDERTLEERAKKPGDVVRWTFRVLEKIVIRIMNEPSVSYGRIKLMPRAGVESI